VGGETISTAAGGTKYQGFHIAGIESGPMSSFLFMKFLRKILCLILIHSFYELERKHYYEAADVEFPIYKCRHCGKEYVDWWTNTGFG
jgi:hypothetical protein